MTFSELLAEIQKLRREEQRSLTEDYLEIVVSKDGLDPLNKVLAGYFGSPLKPEGSAPSGEANRHAKPYGGIRKDQTLYFRQAEGYSEYAFLWPWGSGTRITIKILRSRSPSPSMSPLGFLAKLFGK